MALRATSLKPRGLRAAPPRRQRGFIAPWLDAGPSAGSPGSVTFEWRGQTSLVPEKARGSATPTFTRATTAYVEDFEGLLKPVLSGEARFKGARRVHNCVAGSSVDLTASGWGATGTITPSYTTTPSGRSASRVQSGASDFAASNTCVGQAATSLYLGRTFIISALVKSTSGTNQTFRLRATSLGAFDYYGADLTATSSWQRFYFTKTFTSADTGNLGCGINKGSGGSAFDIIVSDVQAEDVTGQSNQNPSEHVSVGVLSAPYHGANVDGVKNFLTHNGNTVSSNVVTDATGDAIVPTAALPCRYFREQQRQNLLPYSNAFNDATWNKFQSTISANAVVAPDGTTTADTLTADTNTGQHAVRKSVTVANGMVHTFSVYAKAGTTAWIHLQSVPMASAEAYFNLSGAGSVGTVSGATATITAAQNGWYLCTMTGTTNATSGNNQIELAEGDNDVNSGASSGLTAHIWGAQLEPGENATSRITTTSAAATRNSDVLKFSRAGNIFDAQGALTCKTWIGSLDDGGNQARIVSQEVGAGSPIGIGAHTGYVNLGAAFDGSNSASGPAGTPAANTEYRLGSRWGSGKMRVFCNGSGGTEANYDGSFGLEADDEIFIGTWSASTDDLNGCIGDLKIYSRPPSDARMQALTT